MIIFESAYSLLACHYSHVDWIYIYPGIDAAWMFLGLTFSLTNLQESSDRDDVHELFESPTCWANMQDTYLQ